jgi:hypothetical protein
MPLLNLFIYLSTALSINPFLIDFEEKEDLSQEDYLILQEKLAQHDIKDYLRSFYKNNKDKCPDLIDEIEFLSRTMRALKTKFIDVENNLFPHVDLIKINGGGNTCIVSGAPFRIYYPEMLALQIEQLKKTGFNGYHLSFWGAFPNPSGREIKYCAIPYAKKLLAILEAKKRGFENVIWIDSALIPNKDITPLFADLEKVGCIYTNLDKNGFSEKGKQYLPPDTSEVLKQLTGHDSKDEPYVVGAILGFNCTDSLFWELEQDYFRCLDLGTPFLSCNPEEYVLTAILAQPKFKRWREYNCKNRSLFFHNLNFRQFSDLRPLRKSNSYFLHIKHPHAFDIFDDFQERQELIDASDLHWVKIMKNKNIENSK